MSVETFQQLTDLVLENSTKPCITFFYGGEPMLLPNSWYETVWNMTIKRPNIAVKLQHFPCNQIYFELTKVNTAI